MNRTFTLSLALAAGLLGGLLPRYMTPLPVLAQAGTPQQEIKRWRQCYIRRSLLLIRS